MSNDSFISKASPGWDIVWDKSIEEYYLNGPVGLELRIAPECSDFNHSTATYAAIWIDRRGPEEWPNFDLPVVKLQEYDAVKAAIEEFEAENGREKYVIETEAQA